MKYDDKKAIDNGYGGYNFIQVESVIDEIRSDCTKDKCDLIVLYDNTEVFKRFAIYKNGDLYILSDQIPTWFEKYVK